VRAVVLDGAGRPGLTDLPEPAGEGERVRVLACGLCGSDVEKLGVAAAGTVLGHEVAGELDDGRRVALVHHLSCGECERCLAGHESTCQRFREPTILPGGFAERVRATGGWVELPETLDPVLASYAEPLACVLRGTERVPRGRVLVVGRGFVGRLFEAVLARRGDDVFGVDADPARAGRTPDGPVEAAVLCAPAAPLDAVVPGGTVLAFAPAAPVALDDVYRRELTLTGSRSATPRHLEDAVALLQELDVPEPTVLPLERFAEGLELYRSRSALKVVFTP
jgi:L-iditol 2-dehydrogenase